MLRYFFILRFKQFFRFVFEKGCVKMLVIALLLLPQLVITLFLILGKGDEKDSFIPNIPNYWYFEILPFGYLLMNRITNKSFFRFIQVQHSSKDRLLIQLLDLMPFCILFLLVPALFHRFILTWINLILLIISILLLPRMKITFNKPLISLFPKHHLLSNRSIRIVAPLFLFLIYPFIMGVLYDNTNLRWVIIGSIFIFFVGSHVYYTEPLYYVWNHIRQPSTFLFYEIGVMLRNAFLLLFPFILVEGITQNVSISFFTLWIIISAILVVIVLSFIKYATYPSLFDSQILTFLWLIVLTIFGQFFFSAVELICLILFLSIIPLYFMANKNLRLLFYVKH